MTLLVGSTIPAYKMHPGDGGTRWLSNADALSRSVVPAGWTGTEAVGYFAALEVDHRGLKPFADLLRMLSGRGEHWTFSLDTQTPMITGDERLIRICTGRNLIREYAMRNGYDWVLWIDSDMAAPDDVLPKLLELDYPVVGAQVPVYCQSGAPVKGAPSLMCSIGNDGPGNIRHSFGDGVSVREKCSTDTAGLLLMHRSVFSKVSWRYDGDAGMTDDPAMFHDCAALGWPLLVREDVIGVHEPLSSLEDRGHDLRVVR